MKDLAKDVEKVCDGGQVPIDRLGEQISTRDWPHAGKCATAQVNVAWQGARDMLTHAIDDLNREAGRGLTAAELAVDLVALRDSLPAVLSPAADRALARLVSDAEHVRRGRR